jgi:RNA polymerase sigma-54 factor
MALEIRQQLKLSQQLVMTPQLQQAIKLLQLSRIELEEVVRQELEENPVLEEGVDVAEDKELAAEVAQISEIPEPSASSDEVKEFQGNLEEFNQADWQNYLDGYNASGATVDTYEAEEERPSFESLLTKKTSLADHLLWQLNLIRIPDDERSAASEIIGNIDEDGYLKATVEEISQAAGVSIEATERALNVVRDFDPAGVASHNLRECLLKQAEVLGMGDSLVGTMLRDHIDELENRKFQSIARTLGLPLDDVLGAARVISGLDPRPGRAYSQEEIQYITPDIYVHKIGDEYVVVLNDEGLPSLRINSFYRNALSGGQKVDEKAGEYIQEKLRGAIWLIKSIHQRQRTIFRVTKSIVKFQRDFFEKGIEYLKPLVLRDVAEDIEMHESTVSRVTTNKYVQTPRGLFELKYFFNSGINTTVGESIASESVKSKIRDIVAEENPKKPYSDQKIVDILHQEGIDIARRTVTKYREMLNIRSSTERKRLF